MDYKELKEYNDYELLDYVADYNEDAHNMLFQKYRPLIVSTATKMIKSSNALGIETNDLIQEGMVGLSMAITTFEDKKDTLFYTYAKKCIERKMISLMVSASRQKHRILNESLSIESGENSSTLDYLLFDDTTNPERMIINTEVQKELITKIKDILTEFEWQVFELKTNGFNYHEIADILDKDSKAIDNAIQRIRNKIKNNLEKDNIYESDNL